MAIHAGTKIGPYEVLGLIGAGGMGEVYRARDPRLQRDVAIKILPASFSSDSDRLRRFEQEAFATAALKHPNILSVYDVGTYQPIASENEGVAAAAQQCPYIVSELLEGESLRDRLRTSPLPLRKAIEYALQISRGLAAAHDKGIIHRDLKPDNIFLTEDGQVKILDFGLAKLTRPDDSNEGRTMTRVVDSNAGTVLGTVGYMSPEQVRGRATDARSDLFSFGAILYEMITGKRAFHGDSAADVMSAILHQEPGELTETNRAVSPALERIVRHCLEKNPAERFQSARDVAFDLESISGTSQSSARLQPAGASVRLRKFAPLLWVAALLATATIAFSYGKRGVTPPPEFLALSYERGAIPNARFAQDGRTVIYDATWDGKPVRVFTTPAESAQPRALEFDSAHLYSISRTGELAIGTSGRLGNHLDYRGATLGRAPLAGGAARPVLDDIAYADWAPDGILAVLHTVNGHDRVEFPIGHVLYETSGWTDWIRVSPDGKNIAFLEHPRWPDDRGAVAVVDTSGHKRTLTPEFESIDGLAWAPTGEIWFTATTGTAFRFLQAVDLSGRARTVLRAPGTLNLFDISSDGRVLLAVSNEKVGIKAHRPGQTGESDLSWSGWTIADDISKDQKTLLLNEQSVIAGPDYIVGTRTLDGSPPLRLGVGNSGNFSPDGKWVSSVPISGAPRTMLYPVGVGAAKEIPSPLEKLQISWFTDDHHLLLVGYEKGHAARCFQQDIASGKIVPVTPEGAIDCIGSADGKTVAAPDASRKLTIYSTDGGPPRVLPINTAGMIPIRFSNRNTLFAVRQDEMPMPIVEINLATGRQQVVTSLQPGDAAGLIGISPVVVSPDAKAYAYSYRRTLAELYIVTGLK